MVDLIVIWESHPIFGATSQMLGCKIFKKVTKYTRLQAQYLHYCANLTLRDPVEMRSDTSTDHRQGYKGSTVRILKAATKACATGNHHKLIRYNAIQ